jgi:hypothetical protein
MTDVTNTINEHDEWGQSTSVVQITDDKKVDLQETLDTANVVDSMEFFMMSNEVAEIFRKEIQQANIQSLKDVTIIDFSYDLNGGRRSPEIGSLSLALEKILAHPEKKIILTSLVDVDRFLNSERISNNKKDTLKLLLSKPNVKFLQVPYSLDELGKVFENKEEIKNPIDTIQFYESRWWHPYLKEFFSTLDVKALHLENSIVVDLRAEKKWDDMAWVNIAYETLQKHPDSKIILCSLIPVEIFQAVIKWTKTEEYINALLKWKNVKIIQSSGWNSMTEEEVLKQFDGLYKEAVEENSAKETFQTISDIESEASFQKLIEWEVIRFLHDVKDRVENDGSTSIAYDDRLGYFFNQPDDIKSEKRIAFEDRLIWLLQLQHPSFKTFPRKNNLQWIVDTYKYARMHMLPEWTKFEGVFVDRDGCIYSNTNKTFNQDVIDLVKKYEQEGKQIRLWTQGNVELKQKLLDEAGLPYIVESKTDYKGWTVEISIDNDSEETLYGKAKIKSDHHVQVKTAK